VHHFYDGYALPWEARAAFRLKDGNAEASEEEQRHKSMSSGKPVGRL